MQLSRHFSNLRFTQQAIRSALTILGSFSKNPDKPIFKLYTATIQTDEQSDEWTLDTLEELFEAYSKARDLLLCQEFASKSGDFTVGFSLSLHPSGTTIGVRSRTKSEISAVMNVFEQHRSSATQIRTAEEIEQERPPFVVFIGHGRSTDWIELKSHLKDKHGINVEAYESGERAGHTIRDILEEMLGKSSIAFLVLTGEDETADGAVRARQNVVHETGLFQGRLGFSKAVVLLEEGVEGFSNLHGIQYIPFAKGGIRSTFGDVLAVIRREAMARD